MNDRPATQRWRLRTELRRIREAAGLTREHVAQGMEWSLSKLVRIETGLVGISTSDLRGLLDFYGFDDVSRRQQLITFARMSRRQLWWNNSQILYPQFQRYIAYELEAFAIQIYAPLAIPGLFQTEAYMRAVMAGAELTETSPEQLATFVDIRLRRQREVLHRADPPEVVTVLDESALHRAVGGYQVMHEQIEHLIALTRRDGIGIHVLPFAAGAYPAMERAFTILELEGGGEILYFTGSSHDLIQDDEESIAQHRWAMNRLRVIALDRDQSVEKMAALATDLR